jgi:hypothetical protein
MMIRPYALSYLILRDNKTRTVKYPIEGVNE